MADSPSWRVKILAPVLASAVTLLVLGGIGEVLVRYREHHRDAVPSVMPFLYYRHNALRYALVRDYSYFGWVHINPQGFRGTRPVTVERRPGTVRIIAVGGSTTFDTQVSTDSAAWPARLQYWLQQLAPGQPVEVINAGVPGYNLTQDLVRLETELGEYRPDLIVMYQGHNDLFQNFRSAAVGPGTDDPHRPNEIETVTPWAHWLEQHSLLYAKLIERLRKLGFARLRGTRAPTSATAVRPSGELDDGASRFARLVALYLAAAQAESLKVVVPELVQIAGLTEHPDETARLVWTAAVPVASPETVLRGYRNYNEVLREVSRQYHVPVLATTGLGLVGKQFYAADDPIHFNDRGADVFAEGLAREMVTRGLLASAP